MLAKTTRALGLPWRWSDRRYAELLRVAGGRERLLHDMQCRDPALAHPRKRRALADRFENPVDERFGAPALMGRDGHVEQLCRRVVDGVAGAPVSHVGQGVAEDDHARGLELRFDLAPAAGGEREQRGGRECEQHSAHPLECHDWKSP